MLYLIASQKQTFQFLELGSSGPYPIYWSPGSRIHRSLPSTFYVIKNDCQLHLHSIIALRVLYISYLRTLHNQHISLLVVTLQLQHFTLAFTLREVDILLAHCTAAVTLIAVYITVVTFQHFILQQFSRTYSTAVIELQHFLFPG